MEAKNVAKGSVKSCGQQIKCIRNWKSQYTSGQRSWQWRIVQSNALTPLLTSVQCPVHCSPLPLAQSAASASWTALGPSCIVLQIDFVARLQDRQRQRQRERERRLLAKRGQQFAKQHCAYMPTTKLFGIFCLCCHWFIGLPSAHTASSSGNSLQFEFDCIRIINYIPQSEMYN